ncbi:MAG TPA: TonB family protein [Opitutaceae bacterium]|jgi:protein TonB
MKRRFAVPLAITVSLELLVFSLNHKASAQTLPKSPPEIPAPAFVIPADPEPVTDDQGGGSPERAKPNLPSPVSEDPNTRDEPHLDLPMNTIAPPPNPIAIQAGPSHFDPSGNGSGPGIGVAQLDNAPRARVRQPPVYPHQAKAESLTGDVVVDFVVDYNGRVLNAHVVSSTNPIFEEATLRAVSQWRFDPGLRDGRVVRFRMRVPIEFRLDGN